MALCNSPAVVKRKLFAAMAEVSNEPRPDDFTTPRAFTDTDDQDWTPFLILSFIYSLERGALDQQILTFFKRVRAFGKKYRRGMSRNGRKRYNAKIRKKNRKKARKSHPSQKPSMADETDTACDNQEISSTDFMKKLVSRAFKSRNIRPSTSSFVQARQKIKSHVMMDVFYLFNEKLVDAKDLEDAGDTIVIFVDGSNMSIYVNFDEEGNIVETKGKPRSALHLTTATCRELNNMIIDAEVQSFEDKNERTAVIALIKRIRARFPDKKLVFVMDRGFYSAALADLVAALNVMAVFRMKYNVFATLSQGEGLETPIDLEREIQYTNKKKLSDQDPKQYVFVSKSTLDLSKCGGVTDKLSYRLVSAEMSEELKEAERNYSEINGKREEDSDREDQYTSFTYLLTNIPQSVMDADELVALYYERWVMCETGFGLLKYKIGMAGFHSKLQNGIEQEVWLSLVKYNAARSTLGYYEEKILKNERRKKKKAHRKDKKLTLPESKLAIEKSKVPAEGNGYIRKLSFSAMSRCMKLFIEGRINERDIYYEMKQTIVYTVPGRHMPRGNLGKPYKAFQWIIY